MHDAGKHIHEAITFLSIQICCRMRPLLQVLAPFFKVITSLDFVVEDVMRMALREVNYAVDDHFQTQHLDSLPK